MSSSKGMKGLDLPVNMIVIIAIAVLVLVVIAAFFTAQTGGGFGNIALEEAFNRGCATWRSTYNCASPTFTVSGYSLPGQTGPASFSAICAQKVGGAQGGVVDQNAINQCRKLCGCPESTIVIPTGGGPPPPPGTTI